MRPDCAETEVQDAIFADVFLKSSRPARGLLLSAAAHCAALALLPFAGALARYWQDEPAPLQLIAVQRLRVRISEPLYFAPRMPAKPAEPVTRPAAAQSARRGLELPPLPATTVRKEQIILQPQMEALRLPVQLPNVLSWSRRLPDAPRPKPKAFISPGRREEAVKQIALDAPPVLDAPNRETAVGSLNIARAPHVDRPALRMPPSSTTPVRAAGPGSGSGSGPIDPLVGDAANLIAVSGNLSDLNRVLTVPPGSSIPQSAMPGDPGREQGGNAGGNGSRPGAGNSGLPGGSGNSVISLGSPPASPGRVARPAPGAHDMVVIQSAPVDLASGLLTGRPIYSVYLEIGTRKAWILEYCIPEADQAPRADGNTLQLGALSPLQPPYPISTQVPDSDVHAGPGYRFIHGYLTTAGKLRKLALVGQAEPAMQGLLAYVENWVFHPARRDGVPVEVEALLAIPPARR